MENITIPAAVTAIGDYAFNSCSSLKSVTIPNAVKTIGEAAFGFCTELKTITIPKSVITLCANVLRGCDSLTDVYCNIPDPSTVRRLDFFGNYDILSTEEGDYSGRTLHLPQGLAKVYQTDDAWYPYFGQIVEDLAHADVDNDGGISIADVTALIDYVLNGDDSAINIGNANVDGDGTIGIADVTAITDILLFLQWPF
jgi:hypothetical protein